MNETPINEIPINKELHMALLESACYATIIVGSIMLLLGYTLLQMVLIIANATYVCSLVIMCFSLQEERNKNNITII